MARPRTDRSQRRPRPTADRRAARARHRRLGTGFEALEGRTLLASLLAHYPPDPTEFHPTDIGGRYVGDASTADTGSFLLRGSISIEVLPDGFHTLGEIVDVYVEVYGTAGFYQYEGISNPAATYVQMTSVIQGVSKTERVADGYPDPRLGFSVTKVGSTGLGQHMTIQAVVGSTIVLSGSIEGQSQQQEDEFGSKEEMYGALGFFYKVDPAHCSCPHYVSYKDRRVDLGSGSSDLGSASEPLPDVDGDAIPDCMEMFGYSMESSGSRQVVDLPGMGADPRHKDIFVELDHMKGFEPNQLAMQKVIQAFADAPVADAPVKNPDGEDGIHLHIDFGPDSSFGPQYTQADEIPYADSVLGRFSPFPTSDFVDWTGFDNIKDTLDASGRPNFSPARAPVFHYALMVHSIFSPTVRLVDDPIGLSRSAPSSEFVFGWGERTHDENDEATTFMHELGHNLGLEHGGADTVNNKPNYLSVMNYSYPSGLYAKENDPNKHSFGSMFKQDYSRVSLPPLDERALFEGNGLGKSDDLKDYLEGYDIQIRRGEGEYGSSNAYGPIDWNGNGTIDVVPADLDINDDGLLLSSLHPILNGYEDWSKLIYRGGAIGDFLIGDSLPMLTAFDEPPPPPLPDGIVDFDVRVLRHDGDQQVTLSPGSERTSVFTIHNSGRQADTFAIGVQSDLGWASLGGSPTELSLAPGESRDVQVIVRVPGGADPGSSDHIYVTATSSLLPDVHDSQLIVASVPDLVFTVTSTADSGPGSLRQAILDANAASGPAAIQFHLARTDPNFVDDDSGLPGGDADPDVFVISPLSPLPVLSNPRGGITIDSRTQAGFSGQTNPFGPEVVLDGSLGGPGPGLDLASNHNRVFGLDIRRFSTGIVVPGGDDNTIQGNYIGTDPTGGIDQGNTGDGIDLYFGATGNRVGGSAPGEGNLIAGNDRFGIWVVGSDVKGNQIQGNSIGVNRPGTAALSNSFDGIVIQDAPRNTVGGAATGEGNQISGNGRFGIWVVGTNATGNVLMGNLVGTDASGTARLGNSLEGLLIQDAPGNTVGGAGLGEGNVIAANGRFGVWIVGGNARGNTLFGNAIGADTSGTLDLGNSAVGVYIQDAANTTIGGTAAGAGNLIAYNRVDGVRVVGGPGATGNAIRGNGIFSNSGLGIDLAGDGPTPNDAGDADVGPNNLQNRPTLAVANSGVQTRVAGTLSSTPRTAFALDFYASRVADPSGSGEGERYLGKVSVSTDDSGQASFDITLAEATGAGEVITATATDAAGNTSEFSHAIGLVAVISNRAPSLASIGDRQIDAGHALTFNTSATDPDSGQTLTYSLDPGAPEGAGIDPTTGAFTWTPGEAQGPGRYTMTVRATDSGTPALSDTRSFTVTVRGDATIALGLATSSGAPVYGQSLTFSAVVAPMVAGAPMPTGTVQFEVDGSDIGTPVALSDGLAVSIGIVSLPAGSHVITAIYSGDGNYVNRSAMLNQTVGRAPLTLEADNQTRVYGQANPPLTARYSGFVNGDTASVISGAPGLATQATASSGVGSYAITPTLGTLDAANYDFTTFLDGTLSVTPAWLTVAAEDQSRVYGQINPPLTYSVAGFVNGDDPRMLDGAPSLATTAGPTSPVGTYPITISAGTLAARNYTFQLVPGTLVVDRAATWTALTPSAASPLYGVDALGLVARVVAAAPGSGTPTGIVDVFADGTPLVRIDLATGAATLSPTALAPGLHTLRAAYSGDGSFSPSAATATVRVVAPSSLSGVVFVDLNNDGEVGLGEPGIAGVAIRLAGTDDLGRAVDRVLATDAGGAYVFGNLRPGRYTITETQPAGYDQGINAVGTAGGSALGDQFAVDLAADLAAMNYNFGERPTSGQPVRSGQAAGIGFWNNKNGQALIKALNGGVGTQLGDWLASTFPNTFGARAGASNLAGRSNAYVAAFFQGRFVLKDDRLDAQVLATALAVYVTDSRLNPSGVGSSYGFVIDDRGLGSATFSVGLDGSAFGVANNTTMTVLDLLRAADSQSVGGVLYNGNATKRARAKDVFAAVNQAGGI